MKTKILHPLEFIPPSTLKPAHGPGRTTPQLLSEIQHQKQSWDDRVQQTVRKLAFSVIGADVVGFESSLLKMWSA